MAAGIATLDVLASERLIEKAARTGEYLLRSLAAMIPRHEFLCKRAKKSCFFCPPPALGPNKRAKNSRFFLPPALRTDLKSPASAEYFHKTMILKSSSDLQDTTQWLTVNI